MENNETFNRNLRFFVIMTNIVFWLMLGFCGLLMVLGLSMETISKYAPIFCSWASFLVLMLWAKKLLPGKSRKGFIKGLFRDRVKWHIVLLSAGIPGEKGALNILPICIGCGLVLNKNGKSVDKF